MKQIEVIPSAKYVDRSIIEGSTAVVIDVLRATTVMVTAFENGIKEIVPVLTPAEADEVKEKTGEGVLLGGERNAEIIPGFDLDNSPFSYMDDVVKGKILVLTTTNGTLAIRKASEADRVLIASFLNAEAVVELLKNEKRITLICSGTNGDYTLEDGLCAGYLIDMLKSREDVELSDFAHLVHSFYFFSKDDISGAVSVAKHYRSLKKKGYEKDLEYCFRMNESEIVPYYSNGVIRKQA